MFIFKKSTTTFMLMMTIAVKIVAGADESILKFYPYKPILELPEHLCKELEVINLFYSCTIFAADYWKTKVEDYVCMMYFFLLVCLYITCFC